MKRETERIHAVVRDLLEFAQPDRANAREGVVEAPADLRSVVDDIFLLVEPRMVFAGSPFAQKWKERRASRCRPREGLVQVLLNLVLNAGAAAPVDGFVVVRATAPSDGVVRIEVEDNGPGVSPDVRGRLFEPFVTTKEIGKGTGLGLAVCRGLVESAGGAIDYDASYVEGARFYVLLPVLRADSDSPPIDRAARRRGARLRLRRESREEFERSRARARRAQAHHGKPR